jgi:hypothetical protein
MEMTLSVTYWVSDHNLVYVALEEQTCFFVWKVAVIVSEALGKIE